MNGYLIMGAIVAGVAAWGTWHMKSAESARHETAAVRQSLNMAEVEIQNAVATADHNKRVASAFREEALRQRSIAADAAKKSADRLRENNDLRRKISNVTENPPVPDAIELVLESVRMRGAVPGTSGTDDSDKAGSGGEADSAGRDVPPGTDPAPEAPGS